MGTRNLLCVVVDGEYKIAKYGQWDGYPSGQGKGNLKFLSSLDEAGRDQLRANAKKCYFVDEARVEQINEDLSKHQDLLSYDEFSKWFKETYPTFNRNVEQHEILELILAGKGFEQNNSINFAADSLFCEWCYVVDLDKMTFEVYKGFNMTPLEEGERFAFLPLSGEKSFSGETYYPIRHAATYDLRNLPTLKQFLTELEEKDEEETA